MAFDDGRAVVTLEAPGASVRISPRGAELQSWRVADRDLLWDADPLHWPWHAPILFPVVGESVGGQVLVDGHAFPMARHGFARTALFDVIAHTRAAARYRLADSAETRRHYPFAFTLDVDYALTANSLAARFTVGNRDGRELLYSVGFHPALRWPFAGGAANDYSLIFEAPEDPEIPTVTPSGLLRDEGRRVPVAGRVLALVPSLFARDALVFRGVRSRSVRFAGPGGAIDVSYDGMSDLGIWTKPGAPFLCIEPWAGTADRDGADGALRDRPGVRKLAPGASARHEVTMRWQEEGR